MLELADKYQMQAAAAAGGPIPGASIATCGCTAKGSLKNCIGMYEAVVIILNFVVTLNCKPPLLAYDGFSKTSQRLVQLEAKICWVTTTSFLGAFKCQVTST